MLPFCPQNAPASATTVHSKSKLRYVIALGLASFLAGPAHADITVAANSQYFKDWVFADVTPKGINLPAGTPLAGTFGPRTFTVTGTTGTTPALDGFDAWPGSTTGFSSVNLPANIGIPTASKGFWEVVKGELVTQFSNPLPAGTTLFSHDFDNGESVDYRFYRCDGTQVDASGFDFLHMVTAGDPNVITRPASGASDSVWHITATNGASNNTTSGLVFNSAEVCVIKTFSNIVSGRGSVDFALGVPPTASLTIPVRPVPTNSLPALALLGVGLAGLAWRRSKGMEQRNKPL